MTKLEAYFADYAQFHETQGNQWTHAVGIPMILLAVLSWSSHLTGLAESIIAAASIWYLYLDWRYGLPFLAVLVGALYTARGFSLQATWILFVLGWVLQL